MTVAHTTSSVKTWRTCKRQYLHAYVDLDRLAVDGRLRLVGSAFHLGVEHFLHGAELSVILSAVAAKCVGPFWESAEGLVEWRRVRAILRAYFERWAATRRDWQVVSVEKNFEVQLGDSVLAGKPDALMRHLPTGKLYLWEHKTASDDIGNVGTDFWQRLALDTQLAVYQYATEREHGETPAILYDVVKKPGGGPRMKQRIVRRKSETDEEFEARKLAAIETLDEFEERLVTDMLAAPDEHLVRREVHRTGEQQAQAVDELRETIRELETYQGSYPRNDAACRTRFGLCPYLGVCAGVETLDSDRFVRLEAAHPELGSTTSTNGGSFHDDYSDCPL
jgi:hypothetical protein